ncbi:helicase-related protein [Xanthobacter sp. TB0136]|uniref:helicase-related protein n=1 Tax=Xanthobacter sp. TB0136 TaxID=3459177 RepID=UPI00403A18C3
MVSVQGVECAGGRAVYNLEVSGHPSYFADGVLVHNCQYKATLDFIANHPDATTIGLTATPFTAGMAEHWGGMVNVTTTRALIDEKFLVEPKIYVAKSPDDKEFSLSGFGEFTDESASAAGIRIVGDVVQEWIGKTFEHFGGPAKTIVFSPTVEHGRELCAAFSAAGYNFQQISYLDRSEEERAAKIAEFRRPDSIIHGLVSCGVLTKGFDVADVRIGISCKPYRKSLSSHIQEIGRVMRPMEGEDKVCLWLDHSGNIERFALDMFDIWDNGVGDLPSATKKDTVARKREPQEREKVVCPECSGALRGYTCTACGWEKPARSEINEVAGELREFNAPRNLMEPRKGLRAKCVDDPRAVWNAALNYCMEHSRDAVKARKWAYGAFRGIYPGSKLPFGWYDMAPVAPMPDAYALIEREVKRYRKNNHRSAA